MLPKTIVFPDKSEVNTPPSPKTESASTLPAMEVNTTNRKSLVLLEIAGAIFLDWSNERSSRLNVNPNLDIPRSRRGLPTIFFGSITLSNSSALMKPPLNAASLSVVFWSSARWAIADALSYPMIGLSAVTSMRDSPTNLSIRFWSSLIPSILYSRNLTHASPRIRAECNTLLIMIGRIALSSKFPCEAAKATELSSPIT